MAARLIEHGRRLLVRLADGYAILLVLIVMLVSTGFLPWPEASRIVGPPWDRLLDPQAAPRTARLLAGLVVGYGTIRALPWVLRHYQKVLGNGTLVLYGRLCRFALLPCVVAAFLLAWMDHPSLRVVFALRGDIIVLSLPVLLTTTVLSLGILAQAPKPPDRYLPRRLDLLATTLPGLAAFSILLFVDGAVLGRPRPWDGPWGVIVLSQLGQLAVELSARFAVIESILADWRDFVASRTIGRFVSTWALGRLLARVALAVLPASTAAWLAVGTTLPSATRILDRDDNLIYVQHVAFVAPLRIGVDSRSISLPMIRAMESIEDPGLVSARMSHSPIDPIRLVGVLAAASQSLLRGDGSHLSGGSGIAAQVCKDVSGRPIVALIPDLGTAPWITRRVVWALDRGATLAEKLFFELPCAWDYERFSRHLGDERAPIVAYLNRVNFGHGAYGVEAAALVYFGKHASEVEWPQAALLAGLPQAPGAFDPWSDPGPVVRRRGQVLEAAIRSGYLSKADAHQIGATPLGVLPAPGTPSAAPAGLRAPLVAWIESHGLGRLSTSGYLVFTTIDMASQRAVQAATEQAIAALRQRGVNDGAALLYVPETGWVPAVVGGSPEHSVDAALVLAFEPASTIKPFVFACALERGVLRPDELLDDTERPIGGIKIENWDRQSLGRRPAALQLAESRNTSAAELVERLTPAGFADCLRDLFGIRAQLAPDVKGVRLGLGMVNIPMLELAAAYGVFASGGFYVEPSALRKVTARDGNMVLSFPPALPRRVLRCETVRWITNALRGPAQELGLPTALAAKTGTLPTSSYAVVYGRNAVVVAWVGHHESGQGIVPLDTVWGREGGASIARAVATNRLGGTSTTFEPIRDTPCR